MKRRRFWSWKERGRHLTTYPDPFLLCSRVRIPTIVTWACKSGPGFNRKRPRILGKRTGCDECGPGFTVNGAGQRMLLLTRWMRPRIQLKTTPDRDFGENYMADIWESGPGLDLKTAPDSYPVLLGVNADEHVPGFRWKRPRIHSSDEHGPGFIVKWPRIHEFGSLKFRSFLLVVAKSNLLWSDA